MGANQSTRLDKSFIGEEVNFDHFQILRAIGKGSFSKVCIVQKKDTKQMFAMKYVNKLQSEQREILKNVIKEVEILAKLEHPFLVNIWFSFQDEEDLFMITDLLLGGDLKYHINHEVHFSEIGVMLLLCEIAHALDYLKKKHILHRDVKPDNILLDEEGHAHLTDFNIATILHNGHLASSLSGTKPYMAPEIFECAVNLCKGYSFTADWWSLGVVGYEMLRGFRPFDIHSGTSIENVRHMFHQEGVHYPSSWSEGIIDLLSKLLCVSPGGRIASVEELRKVKSLEIYDFNLILQRHYKPFFAPPRDHLNCDPTFELEEMIVETKPLHKKKKRLAKQRSIREIQLNAEVEGESPSLDLRLAHIPEFKIYNRYQEMERKERERKELAWEKELQNAMNLSDPLGERKRDESQIPTCQSCPKLAECSTSSPKIKKMMSCDSSFKKGNKMRSTEKCKSTSGQDKFLPEESDEFTEPPEKDKKTGGSERGDEIQKKLHSMEFIDRTPSPVDRSDGT